MEDCPSQVLSTMSASEKSSKGTVAIVGSGPAGIFAAYALQREGYSVTIIDKVRWIGSGKEYEVETQ